MVMSVQPGDVVGALEFWLRSKPRVRFRKYTCCTAGGRLTSFPPSSFISLLHSTRGEFVRNGVVKSTLKLISSILEAKE